MTVSFRKSARNRLVPRVQPATRHGAKPVLVCVLGDFRLLKLGRSVAISRGGKIESLLRILALRPTHSIPRDRLLSALWPGVTPGMAGQSLNSLVYALRRLLSDALDGAAPVSHTGGLYRLNTDAGVGTDIAMFETLARTGDQYLHDGKPSDAVRAYRDAIGWYEGDLDAGTDIEWIIELERLRAHYLTLLVRLADLYYGQGAYAAALRHALLSLSRDPCREDAHRMAMRCYVKLGERAQALRQYRLCEHILRTEFNATPEPATSKLYEKVRVDPVAL